MAQKCLMLKLTNITITEYQTSQSLLRFSGLINYLQAFQTVEGVV